jgi:hypothetical protein
MLMERNGFAAVVLEVILLVIIIGLVVFAILIPNFKDVSNTTGRFQSCSGFIGALDGKEGFCFPDTTTTKCDPTAKDSNGKPAPTLPPGAIWQYIGSGWGCPKTTYCCIQIGGGQNPVRGADVNAAAAQSQLANAPPPKTCSGVATIEPGFRTELQKLDAATYNKVGTYLLSQCKTLPSSDFYECTIDTTKSTDPMINKNRIFAKCKLNTGQTNCQIIKLDRFVGTLCAP